jgi:uncharacterized protein YkwD
LREPAAGGKSGGDRQSERGQAIPALDLPATETAIVEATNAFRSKHNLSALRPNPQLAAAARAYARSLAAMKDLTHTANGTTPATRAQAAGYAYCVIAENLAAIYDSRGFSPHGYAQRALDGWEASPGHRENLMRPAVSEIGIGVAGSSSNDPRYVAVQLLGRPSSMKYSFTVANKAGLPVSYSFDGKERTVRDHESVRHTVCAPGVLAITTGKSVERYEPKNGQVFTLRPAGGGVSVAVGSAPAH